MFFKAFLNCRQAINRGSPSLYRNFSTTTTKVLRAKGSKKKYFLIPIPFIAFGLGCWQVKRRNWKEQMIADIQTNANRDALPLNLNEGKIPNFSHVSFSGEFDHTYEFCVAPRRNPTQTNVSGVHLITPFVLDSGERILVNRGFVPFDKEDKSTRPESLIEGKLDLTGYVVEGEKTSRLFSIGKKPVESNHWTLIDLEKMAKLSNALPLLIDLNEDFTPSGKIPQAGVTIFHPSNNHIYYIFTWFPISAYGAWACLKFFKRV